MPDMVIVVDMPLLATPASDAARSAPHCSHFVQSIAKMATVVVSLRLLALSPALDCVVAVLAVVLPVLAGAGPVVVVYFAPTLGGLTVVAVDEDDAASPAQFSQPVLHLVSVVGILISSAAAFFRRSSHSADFGEWAAAAALSWRWLFAVGVPAPCFVLLAEALFVVFDEEFVASAVLDEDATSESSMVDVAAVFVCTIANSGCWFAPATVVAASLVVEVASADRRTYLAVVVAKLLEVAAVST